MLFAYFHSKQELFLKYMQFKGKKPCTFRTRQVLKNLMSKAHRFQAVRYRQMTVYIIGNNGNSSSNYTKICFSCIKINGEKWYMTKLRSSLFIFLFKVQFYEHVHLLSVINRDHLTDLHQCSYYSMNFLIAL